MYLPPGRRAGALVGAIALCGSLLGLQPAWAGSTATTTTTTKPPRSTTTTTAPHRPTTTTSSTSTSTTSTTSTTTTTTTTTTVPKRAGVPSVPVGGPATSVPKPATKSGKGKNAKPSPPPPPPNPGPILAAVHDSLAQLGAISAYKPAEAAASASQQQVALANTRLGAAAGVLAASRQVQAHAITSSAEADARLRSLAIAAYIGVTYSTGAGPQIGGNQAVAGGGGGAAGAETPAGVGSSPTGGTTTLGDLAGLDAVDGSVMLNLVGQEVRGQADNAARIVAADKKAVELALAGYARTQAGVAQAEARLQASRHTLQLVMSAATTPKLASTIDLAVLAGQTAGTAAGAPAASTGAAPTTVAGASNTSPPTTVSLTTVAAGGATGGSGSSSAPSPTILGPPVLDGPELAAWFASTKHQAHITVTIQQLAADYQAAGRATGVRDDLAFAQSVIETGYFSFPSYGQLTPKDNNFAGIGACDSCAHGWSFPNAQTGVGAQMELLEVYASPKKVPTPLIGPAGVGGCCSTWMALGGTWASSLSYGISILTVYNQMLTWLIPQRLVQAGILLPARPAGLARGTASPTTSTPVSTTTPAPTAASPPPAAAAADSGSRPSSTSVIAAHYR